MSDEGYAPIKGKCTWWREMPNEEDRWDVRLKEHERRVYCSCFVEGKGWTVTRADVPSDCPDARHCRYYIKNL
ncbi:MAG: hypothetical protein FDZ75_00560 [Actinobacteria bacterium]|nr:MAG: hypothetical protein FDZ75_00560 [Actinomycetota bacterium]